MTEQPMDYRDWLIRQHEQERMRQRFEGLFSKSDDDHAAEQADRVSQLAYDTAEECVVGASEVEEALTEVVTEARDLRKRISSGLVSEKDARARLVTFGSDARSRWLGPRRSRPCTRAP